MMKGHPRQLQTARNQETGAADETVFLLLLLSCIHTHDNYISNETLEDQSG